MNSFLRNTVSKLYNAVSPSVAATRGTLVERLQSVRETVSLLYNRMIYRVWKRDIERHHNKSKGRRRRNYRTDKATSI